MTNETATRDKLRPAQARIVFRLSSRLDYLELRLVQSRLADEDEYAQVLEAYTRTARLFAAAIR